MFKYLPKTKALAALAVLPVAGISGLAGAAQYVPLFDAMNLEVSMVSPPPAESFIKDAYVFKANTVVTYCDAPSTAYIRSDKGDGTYGPPLVDNYITAGDDKKSVCVGGPPLPNDLGHTGTHCFKSGKTSPVKVPIETTFDGTGVSAPISLNTGGNTTTFKLWDYGGVVGNAKLVLELPAACNTVNQWCSPGYWKNHPAAWTALAALPNPILPTDPWGGPIKYDAKKCARYGAPSSPTLYEVISTPQCYGGEAANAVADMLSAAHPGISFFGVRVEGSCPLN